MALVANEFVAVWLQNSQGSGNQIRGRILDSDGKPVVNAITSDALDFPISRQPMQIDSAR